MKEITKRFSSNMKLKLEDKLKENYLSNMTSQKTTGWKIFFNIQIHFFGPHGEVFTLAGTYYSNQFP